MSVLKRPQRTTRPIPVFGDPDATAVMVLGFTFLSGGRFEQGNVRSDNGSKRLAQVRRLCLVGYGGL